MKADLHEKAGAPDVAKMGKDFERSLAEGGSFWRRAELNYRTRYCVWAGQSEDGRRWRAKDGKSTVFPWPGASDARVNLIDKYIKKDKAFLVTLWRRMKIRAEGVEGNDLEFGTRLTQVLRWMKYTQMTEALREVRLLADCMLHRGTAFLGVFWCRERQLGYEEIDLETLVNMAQSAMMEAQMGGGEFLTGGNGGNGGGGFGEAVMELPQMILDGADREAVKVLEVLYPDTKDWGRAIRELRETGRTRVVRPYNLKDRPTIWAGAPQEDILTPPEMTTDLHEARYLQRRELVTETTLRGRMQGYGYDKGWVNEVVKTQRGRITGGAGRQLHAQRNRILGRRDEDASELFELVHDYRRLGDANGVPGIYYTCFAPGLLDRRKSGSAYAYHDLLSYDHGEYPFVLFEQETIGRRIGEARGYGEVGSTWQQQVKTEWDSRIDRASIATLPPSYHPPGEPPEAWGPGVKIPTMRPEEYGFMKIPQYDPGSKEVQETVEAFADDYFGQRLTEDGDQALMGMMRQCMGDDWMGAWQLADTQVLQLMQQFLPEEFYYRVVGSGKAKPIHGSREEIQGKFDLRITYNVEELDPEKRKERMELVELLLNMDTTGRVDRDEVLSVVAEVIDPNLGERILRPAEEATRLEIEDEQNVFARMFAGVDVDIKPGQNYGLRLRVLNNILQTNVVGQKRYMGDEQFRGLIDKRIKQLGFQVEQGQNAQIGRFYGTKPSEQTRMMEGAAQRPEG